MAQQYCTLGTGTGKVTFSYNAPEQSNPWPVSNTFVPTLGGGYMTQWPRYQQDRVVQLQWPLMDSAMYAALDALMGTLGTMPFTDWNGTAFTVAPEHPGLTHKSILRGGNDAYEQVSLTLRVLSSP